MCVCVTSETLHFLKLGKIEFFTMSVLCGWHWVKTVIGFYKLWQICRDPHGFPYYLHIRRPCILLLESQNKAQEGRKASAEFALQAPSRVLLFLDPFILQELQSHTAIQHLQVFKQHYPTAYMYRFTKYISIRWYREQQFHSTNLHDLLCWNICAMPRIVPRLMCWHRVSCLTKHHQLICSCSDKLAKHGIVSLQHRKAEGRRKKLLW